MSDTDTTVTLSGSMAWLAEQLELHGYKVLPCGNCGRAAPLGVHYIHGGIVYLLEAQKALTQRAEQAEATLTHQAQTLAQIEQEMRTGLAALDELSAGTPTYTRLSLTLVAARADFRKWADTLASLRRSS